MRDYIIYSEARLIRRSRLIDANDKMLDRVQVTVVIVDLNSSQGESEASDTTLDNQLWSLLGQGDHFIDRHVMLAVDTRAMARIESSTSLLFARARAGR